MSHGLEFSPVPVAEQIWKVVAFGLLGLFGR